MIPLLHGKHKTSLHTVLFLCPFFSSLHSSSSFRSTHVGLLDLPPSPPPFFLSCRRERYGISAVLLQRKKETTFDVLIHGNLGGKEEGTRAPETGSKTDRSGCLNMYIFTTIPYRLLVFDGEQSLHIGDYGLYLGAYYVMPIPPAFYHGVPSPLSPRSFPDRHVR